MSDLTPEYIEWLETSGYFFKGRICPTHGRELRGWQRLGKLECPIRECPYWEHHACEHDGRDCDCEQTAVKRSLVTRQATEPKE